MKIRHVPAIVVCLASVSLSARPARKTANSRKGPRGDGRAQVSGLIMPLDNESMYIVNNDGRTVVKWTDKTKVALDTNYRQIGNVQGDVIKYAIHSSGQAFDIKLPAGQKYATRHGRSAEKDLKAPPDRGLRSMAVREGQ